ncbi:MAG: hypothetical protein LBQ06_05895 [Frankiaceae bacterium]|nr:hypothetical protein [Frankiaceae bacterium]
MTEPTDTLTLPPGSDPALAYARPDVERIVLDTIKPLGGVVTWSFAAGEGDPPGWLFTMNLQVDIRAHRRAACAARADMARRAICALPWGDQSRGVVNRVDVTEGPFWQPDENGAPRYVARYAITCHPARDGGRE